MSSESDESDPPVRTVRVTELFVMPDRALVIYHLMLGKKQTKACPMCTVWMDGFNCVAEHITQNVNFVIVAAAEVPALRAHGRARGWNRVRLVSAGSSTFKYDLGSADREGRQDSTVSVFSKASDGSIRMPHLACARPDSAGPTRFLYETRISEKELAGPTDRATGEVRFV